MAGRRDDRAARHLALAMTFAVGFLVGAVLATAAPFAAAPLAVWLHERNLERGR